MQKPNRASDMKEHLTWILNFLFDKKMKPVHKTKKRTKQEY